MPHVIVTAEVEDAAKWEKGFRTHGKLFREQSIKKPIRFAITGNNQLTCHFQPDDLDTYMRIMDSPATAKAMEFDGVKRETVKVVVLDKEFDPR